MKKFGFWGRSSITKKILLGVVVLTALLGGYISLTQVDNVITVEDENAISQLLGPSSEDGQDVEKSFEKELGIIRLVQKAVLDAIPVDAGIPHGHPREPTDLLLLGEGLCFDRSRFIEKALRHKGFETRHIAIYSTLDTGSALRSLLTPQVSSHAVTEVRTSRGWLVVDSNEPWISLSKDYQPLSINGLSALNAGALEERLLSQPENFIYGAGFTFIYGLYSRHGKFYPPYHNFPDINVSEFAQNLTRLLP